jgi:hypothetical protein
MAHDAGPWNNPDHPEAIAATKIYQLVEVILNWSKERPTNPILTSKQARELAGAIVASKAVS